MSSQPNIVPVPVDNNTNFNEEVELSNIHAQFWYNNVLFLAQFIFSCFGIGFSAAMLLKGSDATIYLPILTSLLFLWVPSPASTKIPQGTGVLPSGIPQMKALMGSKKPPTNDVFPNINNLRNLDLEAQNNV